MHLSERISNKIAAELGLDQEKSDVIAYGAFALMQILLALILVAVLGLVFGVLVQALVASFTASILRQYSGGVHASKSSLCLIMGTIVTILIALAAKYLAPYLTMYWVLIIGFVLFVYSYYIIYKYAPVDSAAKPIKTDKKKKRMRKISFTIMAFYTLVFLLLILINHLTKNVIYITISLSLVGALGWQAFTLTTIGHRVLKRIDVLLDRVLFRKGE